MRSLPQKDFFVSGEILRRDEAVEENGGVPDEGFEKPESGGMNKLEYRGYRTVCQIVGVMAVAEAVPVVVFAMASMCVIVVMSIGKIDFPGARARGHAGDDAMVSGQDHLLRRMTAKNEGICGKEIYQQEKRSQQGFMAVQLLQRSVLQFRSGGRDSKA